MVSTDAAYFAAAVAIKQEYGMLKRNAIVALYGVAQSNAKCAIIDEKSIFAIKTTAFN